MHPEYLAPIPEISPADFPNTFPDRMAFVGQGHRTLQLQWETEAEWLILDLDQTHAFQNGYSITKVGTTPPTDEVNGYFELHDSDWVADFWEIAEANGFPESHLPLRHFVFFLRGRILECLASDPTIIRVAK